MDNIIFIGMPAVGKSTVGVIVAKQIGYRFLDTDLLIQEEEGKLLKNIIREKGIEGFLAVEDRVIGKVVYLKASFETIKKRLSDAKNRGVVLKEGQTLKDLYDERVRLFEKYADITICEDGRSLEDTVDLVLENLAVS